MPDKAPETDKLAMVQRRLDGRWEVVTSQSDGRDGPRRWRHKKMFETEQEAERYARSLLIYCDTVWRGHGSTQG